MEEFENEVVQLNRLSENTEKNQKILYDMACNCEIHFNSSLSFSAIASTLSIHFNLNLI